MRRTLLTVALAVLFAIPAAAQQPLKLSFENGRVSIDAASVPVRTILNEWAKIGGTKVIGAERIAGAPVTVKLVNVTEAQALETILRSVAGYMAAPRNNIASTGPSMYDRILIMATTTAPATANAARPAAANPNAFNGTQRFIPPRQQQIAEQQAEADEPDDNPPSPPVFTFPQQGQANGYPPPQQFNGAPGVATPGTNAPAPQTITINPSQGAPGQPAMPPSVAQPGMMVPAPQPANPPGMIRPPGNR